MFPGDINTENMKNTWWSQLHSPTHNQTRISSLLFLKSSFLREQTTDFSVFHDCRSWSIHTSLSPALIGVLSLAQNGTVSTSVKHQAYRWSVLNQWPCFPLSVLAIGLFPAPFSQTLGSWRLRRRRDLRSYVQQKPSSPTLLSFSHYTVNSAITKWPCFIETPSRFK